MVISRSIEDNLVETWASELKSGRELPLAYLGRALRFIFSFHFPLVLKISVIFIHFNSRCEIVGCHLPFCSAASQNYKWVDINGSPEFSAVLVDGIENVFI